MAGEVEEAGLEAMLLWTIRIALDDHGLHVVVQRPARYAAEPVEAVRMASQQRGELHIDDKLDIGCPPVPQGGDEGKERRTLAATELDPVDLHLVTRRGLEAHQRIRRWRGI